MAHIHSLLHHWPPLPPVIALELLDSKYAHLYTYLVYAVQLQSESISILMYLKHLAVLYYLRLMWFLIHQMLVVTVVSLWLQFVMIN